MRGKAFFIFGLMFLPVFLHAQKLTGLVSEEISEYQENTADPDSWIPKYRIIYSYNPKGQVSYSQQMAWNNFSKIWNTTIENYYEYNQKGKEIRNIYKYYTHYPDQLSSIYETRYYYHDWTSPNYFEQAGSYRHFIDYENDEEEIKEQKCTVDTLNHSGSCRYYTKITREKYYYEEIRILNYQGDGQGNTLWQSYWVSENDNGQKNEYTDSTVYHYSNPAYQVPSLTDIYHREWNEDYRLIQQRKREYILDDMGNIIVYQNYTRLPGEDWILFWEDLITYDSLGRIIETIDKDYRDPFPHFRDRTTHAYEILDGEEIDITTQYSWDYEGDQWIPESKGAYISQGQGNSFYFFQEYNWDREMEQFTSKVEEWVSWTEDESGRNTTTRNKGIDLANNLEFDYTHEQGWTNRCDGHIDFSYNWVVEGIPPYDFQTWRQTYYYFDIAECEEGQPATEITVFPNPCHGVLNIYAEDRIGPSSIAISDALGKRIFYDDRELTNFTLIDLKGYKSGMYFLNVSNGELSYSGKFLLVH